MTFKLKVAAFVAGAQIGVHLGGKTFPYALDPSDIVVDILGNNDFAMGHQIANSFWRKAFIVCDFPHFPTYDASHCHFKLRTQLKIPPAIFYGKGKDITKVLLLSAIPSASITWIRF